MGTGARPTCSVGWLRTEPGRALLVGNLVPDGATPNPHKIRVSIGISVFPDDGTDFDALLHAADTQMYAHEERPPPPPDPAADRSVTVPGYGAIRDRPGGDPCRSGVATGQRPSGRTRPFRARSP